MTNREKRKHRRIWRKEKQELRKRKKNVLELQAMTPPKGSFDFRFCLILPL
jgi:hypothetical protein